MSWSEPGGKQVPKGQHMWHRLSVHVKSKEPGCNQTAVIKPLTKSYPSQGKSLTFSDISSKSLYNVVEEEESGAMRFSQLSSPAMVVHRRVMVTPPLLTTAQETHLFLSEQSPQSLSPPPLPQRSIMEQLQGVVHKFATGIPDFNSVIPISGSGNGMRPIYHPPLMGQQQVLPLQMGTFSKEPVSPPPEEDEEENEKFKLIQEYVYERPGNLEEDEDDEEERATNKLTLEDSPALTPPSPFRDSVASGSSVPSSPVSESMLCTPPNAVYASVVLRDYKQSSSTL